MNDDEQQPNQEDVEADAPTVTLTDEPNLHLPTAERASNEDDAARATVKTHSPYPFSEAENNEVNEESNDGGDPPGQYLEPRQEDMEAAAKMVILLDEPNALLSADRASHEDGNDAQEPPGMSTISDHNETAVSGLESDAESEPPLVVASLVHESESIIAGELEERLQQMTETLLSSQQQQFESLSASLSAAIQAASMAGSFSNNAASVVGSNPREQQDMVVFASHDRNPPLPSSITFPRFLGDIPLDPPDFLEEMTQRQRRHIGERSWDVGDIGDLDISTPYIMAEHPEQTQGIQEILPLASIEGIAIGTPVDPPGDTTPPAHQLRKAGGLSEAAIADETDFDRKMPASTGIDESSLTSNITMDPALRIDLNSQPAANISFEDTSIATAHAVLDQDLQSELRRLNDAIVDLQQKLEAVAQQQAEPTGVVDDDEEDEEQSILELYAETMLISSVVLAFGIFIGVSIQHSREIK